MSKTASHTRQNVALHEVLSEVAEPTQTPQKRKYTSSPAVPYSYSHKLAYRLRKIRDEHGITQEALANKAHIAPNTYQKYEHVVSSEEEKTENPTLGNLLAIAEALEVDIRELLPVSYDIAPDDALEGDKTDEGIWLGKH